MVLVIEKKPCHTPLDRNTPQQVDIHFQDGKIAGHNCPWFNDYNNGCGITQEACESPPDPTAIALPKQS